MDIINDLKILWNDLKTWKKVVVSVAFSLICLLLFLVSFNIIHPVWILWSMLIVVTIYLMIKKEIRVH